ncbi:MAG: hypothetical protein V1799_14360 [bacterium]
MFEHRTKPLLTHSAFIRRVAQFALTSLMLILFSLLVGMFGYRLFENLSWVDAFVNAAMLMGGMGPVTELHTDAGKIFAGCYALYCGLVLLIALGLIIAPLFHRFLHKFHLDMEEESSSRGKHSNHGH